MILKVKELQDACKCILEAVDTTTNLVLNETLELEAKDGVLNLSVTNGEYFVTIKLNMETSETFIATVNAKLFLSLIAKITTSDVEITCENNILLIKANGSYKLPMIYDNDKLLKLNPIVINNVTNAFNIPSSVLLSILNFNSKQLLTGAITRPVQKLYYVDEKGCITFTSGATVNTFNLVQPVRLLLSQKLVKLFKLFAKSDDVAFSLGYDEVGANLQQKIKLETPNISVSSILVSDNSMFKSVPVEAIRGRAEAAYHFSININKNELNDAIDRLLIFSNSGNTSSFCVKCRFCETNIVLSSLDGKNEEYIKYINSTLDSQYETLLNIKEVKTIIDNCEEQDLLLEFGNGEAVVIARGNVKNIIQELHIA